jgi:hypothetical protein
MKTKTAGASAIFAACVFIGAGFVSFENDDLSISKPQLIPLALCDAMRGRGPHRPNGM